MATSQGYGKTVISGSVFAYDVGDTRNSFKGEPTVNLVPNADTMANWSSYSAGNDGTFITEFGTTGYRVRNKNTWNGIARGITLPAPGTYPISAWYRIWGKSSGNNGINVYTSGGGISDTAQGGDDTRIGEWQRISMTRTYTTTSITFYIISWGGTSGVDWSSWDVTKPQVEFNSHATPFVNGTRSATQGLLDLTGNNTIDLSNVSFDSNAEMTFDGSNDYVPIPPSLLPTGQITIALVYRNDDSGRSTSVLAGGAGQQDLNIHLPWSDTNVYWDCGRPFNRIYKATTTGERTGMHYWVFTKNPTTGIMNIYLDGNLWHTGGGQTSTLPALTTVSLGCYDSGNSRAYFTAGVIPLAKIYNRALTAAEVKQNYLHYKTRFNLS